MEFFTVSLLYQSNAFCAVWYYKVRLICIQRWKTLNKSEYNNIYNKDVNIPVGFS